MASTGRQSCQESAFQEGVSVLYKCPSSEILGQEAA